MFDLLLNMGGKLDIKNRQGLTPLTLSAKLPRKEVSVFKNIDKCLTLWTHLPQQFLVQSETDIGTDFS